MGMQFFLQLACIPMWNKQNVATVYLGRPEHGSAGFWNCPYATCFEGEFSTYQAQSYNSFGSIVSAMSSIRSILDAQLYDFQICELPVWLAVPHCINSMFVEARIEMEEILNDVAIRSDSNEARIWSEAIAESDLKSSTQYNTFCESELAPVDGVGGMAIISLTTPKLIGDNTWSIVTSIRMDDKHFGYKHFSPSPFQCIAIGIKRLRLEAESLPKQYRFAGPVPLFTYLPLYMPIESGAVAVLEASYYIKKREAFELNELTRKQGRS